MAANDDVPFKTDRDELYSGADLWKGFDEKVPSSFQDTLDFKCYQYFVRNGGATVRNKSAATNEALHDSSILRALHNHLQNNDHVVAIMGGHRMKRGEPDYRLTVQLAKELSERGFLVVSGGGPGAMEATHLGALLKGTKPEDVKNAIDKISEVAELPGDASKVLDKNYQPVPDIVKRLHEWAIPAYEVFNEYFNPERSGKSLAIPTWQYGHEPVTPLATRIAKFFQNSIREDVLLLVPKQGIVYTPGGAGTLQEVFQDAAQNYYEEHPEDLCPMVFFDIGNTWSRKYPVKIILDRLFEGSNDGIKKAYFEKCVRLESVDKIAEFLYKLAANSPKLPKGFSVLSVRGF